MIRDYHRLVWGETAGLTGQISTAKSAARILWQALAPFIRITRRVKNRIDSHRRFRVLVEDSIGKAPNQAATIFIADSGIGHGIPPNVSD